MHELSICKNLMSQVEDIARMHNSDHVSSIVVAIGPLSGIDAQLLKNAYPIVSTGTVAEEAELIVEKFPVRVKCTQCGNESDVLPNNLICKKCGNCQTRLINGDELMLISVELEKPDEPELLH